MPQPVNNNRGSQVQAATDKEAAAFLRLFDTNKTPGIQPDELTDDFVLKFLSKPYAVQKAIVKKLPKDTLDYLNILFSLISSGGIAGPKVTKDIVQKTKAVIKFRYENSTKAPYRYSYIPLKPGPTPNTVRVYC